MLLVAHEVDSARRDEVNEPHRIAKVKHGFVRFVSELSASNARHQRKNVIQHDHDHVGTHVRYGKWRRTGDVPCFALQPPFF